jgi:hypothetical protein
MNLFTTIAISTMVGFVSTAGMATAKIKQSSPTINRVDNPVLLTRNNRDQFPCRFCR